MKQINFSSFHTSLLSMVVWFLIYGCYWLYGSGTNIYEILAIKISKIHLLQTLISPKTVSHKIINNYHFLKMHKKIFWMYACTLLYWTYDFLLISAQNGKKSTILDNLRTITHDGNMGTRQVTPFFHLIFTLCF